MAERIRGYCALCRSRCGCVSIVEDGRLAAVEPDPSHPTGQALCAEGRAAPQLVHHPERLLHPLRRTRPKSDPDPGWERVTWDEALGHAAATLRRLADARGPEMVASAVTSPSGSAMSDAAPWIDRLLNASGTRTTATAPRSATGTIPRGGRPAHDHYVTYARSPAREGSPLWTLPKLFPPPGSAKIAQAAEAVSCPSRHRRAAGGLQC